MAQRALTTTKAASRLLSPTLQISYRSPSRTFHTTPSLAGSPFFDLTRLSASRESQHLSKEKGRPRTEFAPHLELIKESEVAPFVKKSGGGSKIRADDRGPMESRAVAEKPGLKYGLTQDVIEKSTREQHAILYLIKETLRLRAATKDYKQICIREPDGRNGPQFSQEAAEAIAATLPIVEDNLAPKEIDDIAAKSPTVAHLRLNMIKASEALFSAMRDYPSIGPSIGALILAAWKPKNIVDVSDRNYVNHMITSLITELRKKEQAAERKRMSSYARDNRLAFLKALGKIIMLLGALWVLINYDLLGPREKEKLDKDLVEGLNKSLATLRIAIQTLEEAEWRQSPRDSETRNDEAKYVESTSASRLSKWFWAS